MDFIWSEERNKRAIAEEKARIKSNIDRYEHSDRKWTKSYKDFIEEEMPNYQDSNKAKNSSSSVEKNIKLNLPKLNTSSIESVFKSKLSSGSFGKGKVHRYEQTKGHSKWLNL